MARPIEEEKVFSENVVERSRAFRLIADRILAAGIPMKGGA